MQCITHSGFMESVYHLYKMNGQYKNIARTALSIWAKAHNSDVFQQQDIFDLAITGENRLRHCRKYKLPKGCRLITAFDQDTLVFLFLGIHQECDKWLDKHRGKNFFDNIKSDHIQPQHKAIPTIPEQPIIAPIREEHKELIDLQADIENYAENEGYQDNFIFAVRKHAFGHNIDIFLQQDCLAFSNRLDAISQCIRSYSTIDAITRTDELEYYLDFFSLKLKYIDNLKKAVKLQQPKTRNLL